MTQPSQTQASTAIIHAFETSRDTDIYVYSGMIDRDAADRVLAQMATAIPRRRNASLFLTTYGGDPDGAYKTIKALKRAYTAVTLYVFGYCKSAGTLIALGADQLVMSDHGELGPLDIQMVKEDNFFGRTSGLDIIQAMQVLHSQATAMFETMLLDLLQHTGGQLSTRTASDIATDTVVGLLAPIFEQIDPIQLGAMNRANTIAQSYGTRLCNNPEAVRALVLGYPSHGFVIDIEETQSLLGSERVRTPQIDELQLAQLIGPVIRTPANQVTVSRITAPAPEELNVQHQDDHRQEHGGLDAPASIPEGDGGLPVYGEAGGTPSVDPSPAPDSPGTASDMDPTET